jgi:sigma-E factor negative regulatory protein RseB
MPGSVVLHVLGSGSTTPQRTALAWRWLPGLALATLLPFVALLPTVASAQSDTEAKDARQWLVRIQAAAANGNYLGTMVFSVGGAISSSRVAHYTVGDQTYETLEALDGRQQRILRHNDIVYTLWPANGLAVVEKRELLAAWSTTPQEVDPQALEHYIFKREGSARVAGRDAAVILMEPRDALRYAQRLWADQASGLLLRADVLGLLNAADAAATAVLQRAVLESTAFSEVAIDVKPQHEAVLQAIKELRKTAKLRVVRPHQQRTTLEAEGWALAKPVPGFRVAGCLRRGMDTAGDEEPVLQAVFTDGLTHVSVFVESFKPQRHRGEIVAQQGATATLMQRRADWWVTAVGDVPPATLKLFADAMTRRKP